MRNLIREARRIQRAAVRSYVRMRVTLQRSELKRETDAEIREAIQQSNAAFFGGADNA